MAATIIDRLIMTLGLDSSDYDKGRKEVDEGQKKMREGSEKTRKVWEEDGKKAVNTFKAIRNEVLGLVGISLTMAWAKNFATSLIDADAAVGRLAKNLNMTTEDLSAWEGIFTQMGSSASDADNMFRTIQKTVMQVRAGQETTALGPLSRILQGNLGEFMFGNTSNQRRAFLLSEGLTKMGREQAQLWGQQAGYTEDQINALLKGVPVLTKELEERRKIYKVSEAQAEAAARMQKLIDQMAAGWKSLGQELVFALAPTVIDMLNQLSNWLHKPENVREVKEAIRWIADHLKSVPWHAIGLEIQKIWTYADKAATAMGGWGNVVEGLAGAWVLSKFMPLVTGLAMIGRFLVMPVAASSVGGVLLALAGGLSIGTGLNWLIDKGVSAATGRDSETLGGWLYEMTHTPEGKNKILEWLAESRKSGIAEMAAHGADVSQYGNQVTINGNVVVQANDAKGVVQGLTDLGAKPGVRTSTMAASGGR